MTADNQPTAAPQIKPRSDHDNQNDLDVLLAEFTDKMNAGATDDELDQFLAKHSTNTELQELAAVVRRLGKELAPS
jgi:hypothetical protein